MTRASIFSKITISAMLTATVAFAQDSTSTLRAFSEADAQGDMQALRAIVEFRSNSNDCGSLVKSSQIEVDGEFINGISVTIFGEERFYFLSEGQLGTTRGHACQYDNYVEMYAVTCVVW